MTTPVPMTNPEQRPFSVQISAGSADVAAHDGEGVDLRALRAWLVQHRVLAGALALIAASMAWKIAFINHLYFRFDDFIDLDKAIESQFTWKYLTFNGVGHLIIGIRAIAWLLVRISLYDWWLDSGLNLVLVLLAGLAALRLLRLLFGERPAILIPLAIFLFCPLTMPALGEWSSGLESVPLQLATFMALDAHVRYLRSENRRHFVSAFLWVAFGLAFFEKGLALPPMLFAITAAYFVGGGTWLQGMRVTLVRYWRAWGAYAALMIAYGVVLAESLKTSKVQPATPDSTRAVVEVTWGLIGRTFLPAVFGGPWRWFGGGSFALVATPVALVVASAVAAFVVIGVSVLRRPTAWRAWSILAGWLVVADVAPIIVGRVNNFPLALLATETRYVADAVPVLAICLGFAFIPLAREQQAGLQQAGVRQAGERQATGLGAMSWWGERGRRPLQVALASFVGIFAFSSLWSIQAYEDAANGYLASSYVTNATQALRLAPPGTLVADAPVPPNLVLDHNGNYILASELIGDVQRDDAVRKLAWIERPAGTIDGLRIFGPDGRLYLARVIGAVAARAPAGSSWHGCRPERDGSIVVTLATPPPSATTTLRIGYIWASHQPATVAVAYGQTVTELKVRYGLHAAYLPVSGSAGRVVVSDLGGAKMCVGDVEAGVLAPNQAAPALPPLR